MKHCKCKYPSPKLIGNCEVCSKCHCIIVKIRKLFYKRTRIKESKKIYKRVKAKAKLRKELKDDSSFFNRHYNRCYIDVSSYKKWLCKSKQKI